jgi:cell pole-organizing protein PopZ
MSSPQHEPTMEEILASIRKIISEDAPEGAPAPDAPAATAMPEPAPHMAAPPPEADVLELTHEFVEKPAPAMPAPFPEPQNDIVFQAEEPVQAFAPASHDGIFSDQTRAAMDNAFANIPEEPAEPAPAPRAAAPLAPIDGASVENVFERAVRESFEPVMQKYLSDNSSAVIERMKPLIREWMDEHFPALLEGAVRAEVERVVKARGAKR